MIAIYRDGVGGPISEDFVTQLEGPNSEMMNAIRGFAPNYNPKILYTIIDKKSGTRNFEQYDNNLVINPAPGTMVDTIVVERDGNLTFDYFMVANDNPKTATALPVHYKVITNTTGLQKREIEEFTLQQCYSYFGFTGPIKVPAAVKYAEKLAQYSYDTKSSNKIADFKAPNASLSHQLHFL
jgi:aubergine-like protein